MKELAKAGIKRTIRGDGKVVYEIFVARKDILATIEEQGDYDNICLTLDPDYEEGIVSSPY